jgi:hypothetical protein
LQLFKSDLALIRGDLDERGIGARAKDRLGGAALEMLDDAVDYAEDNKGWVAAGAAAVVLWFARKPILGWLADLLEGDDASEEPGEAASRCADDTDSTGDTP